MKVIKKRISHPEFILQKQICEYLNIQYPDVLFLSDTVANLKLTIPQKVRNKSIQKPGFKTPDLLILEPNGNYAGLFIELKVESPFKKDGLLRKDEHLEGQQKAIDKLLQKGYYACFSWGFDQTRRLIDRYMQKTLT